MCSMAFRSPTKARRSLTRFSRSRPAERTKSEQLGYGEAEFTPVADRGDDVTSGAALLFDLDGTLVDSDAKHMAAFQRVFRAAWNRSGPGRL